MEEWCFEIITNVGTARSDYIEAIHKAREGKFDEARALMDSGRKSFLKGHEKHAEMIAKEASGEKVEAGILLMHAEDQLMSAEAFSILAEEFLDLYTDLKKMQPQ